MDWFDDEFEVREVNNVRGLFSKVDIKSGEKVFDIVGEKISVPNRYSVQIDGQTHINVKAPVKYVNHSCDPNLNLVGDHFEAKKDIKAGDEIVFDYLLSEDVLAEPFKCFACGEVLRGKKYKNEISCKLSTG